MANYSTRREDGRSDADRLGSDFRSPGPDRRFEEAAEGCAGHNGTTPRGALVFLDDAAENFVGIFSRGWPSIVIWATASLVMAACGYLLHQHTGHAGRLAQERRWPRTGAE